MSARSFGRASLVGKKSGGGPDPATVERPDRSGAPTLLGLYVTGPSGGTCHLLPEVGLVTIGRSSDCTIALDDASASRSHAALELGLRILISDLGSVNGTFVGKVRVEPGGARPIDLGQTFFIGDSALVIRPSGLRALQAERVLAGQQLIERLCGPSGGPGAPPVSANGVAVLRAGAAGPRADGPALEAILGDLVASAGGWLGRFGGGQVVAACAADTPAAAMALERAAVANLARWSVEADVESTFVRPDSREGREALLALAGGEAPLHLREGAVIIRDPAMKALRRYVGRVAPAPVNVLILGETGAGKDVVAAMLHELSPRADKPFLRINCASLPEALLETELFGHERGAFTDAVRVKTGLLEEADGGTVFLDEIGDLPLSLQAKVLLAIERREVTRVGATRPRKVDVRFVAATNRDVARAVAEQRFRQDLYYRLNAVSINVPPLRERPADIEPLARHFLAEACARFGHAEAALSGPALDALRAHAWPGNIRELRHVIDRAVLVADRTIEPAHFSLSPLPAAGADSPTTAGAARAAGPATATATATATGDDAAAIPEVDAHAVRADALRRALKATAGHRGHAAKLLGISRATLYRQLDAYGIATAEFDARKRGDR